MLATIAGRRPAMVCASTFRGLSETLNLRNSPESFKRETPASSVVASATEAISVSTPMKIASLRLQ
jgi:hypothetical protein